MNLGVDLGKKGSDLRREGPGLSNGVSFAPEAHRNSTTTTMAQGGRVSPNYIEKRASLSKLRKKKKKSKKIEIKAYL